MIALFFLFSRGQLNCIKNFIGNCLFKYLERESDNGGIINSPICQLRFGKLQKWFIEKKKPLSHQQFIGLLQDDIDFHLERCSHM